MLKSLIKKKIDSAYKELKSREHTFRNMDSIKKVLILYNYEEWHLVKEIVQDLEKNGKRVVLWTVEPKNRKIKEEVTELPSTLRARIVLQSETSWHNGLTSIVEDEFRDLKYDTLLDLTTNPDSIMLYLLALNNSDFSIGTKELDYKFYDFTLLAQEGDSMQETYNHIKNYLNNMC